jgi:hypothetical protein
MKNLKILLSASFLILSAIPSIAAGDDENGNIQILNSQINLQNNWSNLNVTARTIGGDAVARGAAAGNLTDVTTMDNTYVTNTQIVAPSATIGSNINMNVDKVWGSVGIQNQVLCNGASISSDPSSTIVNSTQECHAADPYLGITANIRNIAGDAVIQGSAIGNSFEADSNALNFGVNARQTNNSANVSNVNASVFNVGGNAGFSASAVGNTSQIIQYKTH